MINSKKLRLKIIWKFDTEFDKLINLIKIKNKRIKPIIIIIKKLKWLKLRINIM